MEAKHFSYYEEDCRLPMETFKEEFVLIFHIVLKLNCSYKQDRSYNYSIRLTSSYYVRWTLCVLVFQHTTSIPVFNNKCNLEKDITYEEYH